MARSVEKAHSIRMRPQTRETECGFGKSPFHVVLVLAAVIVLLLGLCGVWNPPVYGDHRPSPAVQLETFGLALCDFARDCGRHPTTAEGLDALMTRPSSVQDGRWKGPYLDGTSIRLDPWGRPYVYACPSANTTNQFDLYSCGPDGVSQSNGNDPDDVNYWALDRYYKWGDT